MSLQRLSAATASHFRIMPGLEQRQIGSLDCLVYTTATPPEIMAVFCHGFGAPGDDLVHLGARLLQMFPKLLDRVQMVFPAAPLGLGAFGIPGGRAWWMLDMERLQRAAERGEFRDLRNDLPDELPAVRDQLNETIQILQEELGLPWSKTVLGGFSQGSMLATDVAFHAPEQPAALVIWSGTLLCENVWKELAPRRAGLPVIQSHGRQDTILPFETAQWLGQLLQSAEMQHEFLPFNGGHTIPHSALSRTGELLCYLIDSKD